jgi:Lrp/AsnC family transcriptional regulator, leucine-responsive regulatory protein
MLSKLDEIDIKLLFHLQKSARISAQEISKKIHLSANAVRARIRRLEDQGYIKQYATVLNKNMINKKLVSLTGITLHHNGNGNLLSFLEFVKETPEVGICYHVNETFDFFLYVVVADIQDYHDFLINKLSLIDCVSKIKSFFVLDEIGTAHMIDLSPLMNRFNRKRR